MRLIDRDNLQAILQNIRQYIAGSEKSLVSLLAALDFVISVVAIQPTYALPPNNPLILEELREVDGEPVGLGDIVRGGN